MANTYDISDFPQILLIDTNSPDSSSAALITASNSVVITEQCRAQELLVLVEKVLSQTEIKLQTIKAIGVLQRDGSLTGQRIGTAVANTLAWIIGIPLLTFKHNEINTLATEIKSGKKFEIQKVIHTN